MAQYQELASEPINNTLVLFDIMLVLICSVFTGSSHHGVEVCQLLTNAFRMGEVEVEVEVEVVEVVEVVRCVK